MRAFLPVRPTLLLQLVMLPIAAVTAQCLPVSQLLVLGASTPAPSAAAERAFPSTADLPPAVLRVLPPTTWEYRGTMPATQDVYWTSTEATGAVPALISVRPTQPTHDVVLKTNDGACVRQLRRELEGLHLSPDPVTCPDCTGERYQGAGFTVSFYSHRKGPYRHIVVVAQAPAPTSPGLPRDVKGLERTTAIRQAP